MKAKMQEHTTGIRSNKYSTTKIWGLKLHREENGTRIRGKCLR